MIRITKEKIRWRAIAFNKSWRQTSEERILLFFAFAVKYFWKQIDRMCICFIFTWISKCWYYIVWMYVKNYHCVPALHACFWSRWCDEYSLSSENKDVWWLPPGLKINLLFLISTGVATRQLLSLEVLGGLPWSIFEVQPFVLPVFEFTCQTVCHSTFYVNKVCSTSHQSGVGLVIPVEPFLNLWKYCVLDVKACVENQNDHLSKHYSNFQHKHADGSLFILFHSSISLCFVVPFSIHRMFFFPRSNRISWTGLGPTCLWLDCTLFY